MNKKNPTEDAAGENQSAGEAIKKGEGEMNLIQFSDLMGKSVSRIEKEDIIEGVKQGLITESQAKEVTAELEKADRIWQISEPGIPCAPRFW